MQVLQLHNPAVAQLVDGSSRFGVRRKQLDYFLVFWLLVISGNPGVSMLAGGIESILSVTFLGVGAILLVRRNLQWSRWAAVPFVVFGFLLLIQCLSFQVFPYITIIGFLIRLSIGLIIWMLVPQLPYIFIRIMVFLTVISFFFWISGLVGFLHPLIIRVALQNAEVEAVQPRLSLIIHTYVMTDNGLSFRNAGMFWEGGAFAGFLNLAICLLALQRDQFSAKTYRTYLFFLGAGVLSTLSTAGYIVLGANLLLHSLHSIGRYPNSAGSKRNMAILRIAIVTFFILTVGFYAWRNLPFLGEKIIDQYETARYQERSGWYLTRLGTMVLDWEYIKRRPLTGWGIRHDTRWALHGGGTTLEFRMGNGLSDFTTRFGFIGLLTFAGLTWLGLFRMMRKNRGRAIIALGIILLMLNGENFLNYPFFLGLMFLPIQQPAYILGGSHGM